MKFLSSLFFILSPFALFCSPNGTGLLLCPGFIVLGFVFASKAEGTKTEKFSRVDENGKQHDYKIVTNKQGYVTKVVEQVPGHKFWEWHYKDAMIKAEIRNGKMDEWKIAIEDKQARQWATTVCRAHSAWVPPVEWQEKIARENGFVTEKTLKEREVQRDRVQIGKYFLMKELLEKYGHREIRKDGSDKHYYPRLRIQEDIDKIKMSGNSYVCEYYVMSKFNKSIIDMWNSLSKEEKAQSSKWVDKYEKQLMRMVDAYLDGKCYDVVVNIDF